MESENADDLQSETQPSSTSKPSKKRKLDRDASQNVSSSEGKFHNTNIHSGDLSRDCQAHQNGTFIGFHKGVAVDHLSKRSCGIDICICIFDLTDPSQLSDLLEYIRKDAGRIALIWIAPSCGTESRARERPITGYKSCPKPLRSVVQPHALDGLSGMDMYKEEMPNQLYDAVLQISECAVDLDICVAIGNPTNSQ